jgi:hypothetical protein
MPMNTAFALLAVPAAGLVAWPRTRRSAIQAAVAVIAAWWLIAARKDLLAAGLGVAWLAAYAASIRINGRISHGACGGRGRYHGWFFKGRFRLCGGCGGNGRKVAWGVILFGSAKLKQERQGEVEARRAQRRRSRFAEQD